MDLFVTEKQETETKYEVTRRGKIASVRVTVSVKHNGRNRKPKKGLYYIDASNINDNSSVADIHKAERLYYVPEDCLGDIKECYEKGADPTFLIHGAMNQYPEPDDFDPRYFFRYRIDDWGLWRVGEDTPMTVPIFVDYIVGITNDRYDINKAEEILKGDSRVKNLKRIEIPYYNQEPGLTHALEFSVELHRKTWNKIYRECNKEEGFTFWLRQVLKGWNLDQGLDILKLGKTRKEEDY